MAPAGPCPGCGDAGARGFVEERRDPIGGVLYRLHRCAACGLVFCEPRDPVGPEWYAKEAPLRAVERRPPPVKDWRFLRFLDAGLPPGKILDVGCGDGGFLSLAASRGWTGAGADYDERVIALARAKGLDVCAQDLVEFLKTRAPREFDAAVLFDVLEHAPEPRVLLDALKPALKPGAYLAVTFPNDGRPTFLGREDYDYPPHHFTRWTADALAGLLKRERFEIVVLETVGPSVWWLSEKLFYAWIAPAALGAARRVLFGSKASGSLTGLYEKSAPSTSPAESVGMKGYFADPARRGRLVTYFKLASRLFTYPAGAVLAAVFGLRRNSGEHLYCLARYAP
jgi:2-polyprenyl-3-methyl-5-hydroxy-6-metoxy-1,4-benzoquinol methylase